MVKKSIQISLHHFNVLYKFFSKQPKIFYGQSTVPEVTGTVRAVKAKINPDPVVRLTEEARKSNHCPKETKGCYYERLEDCCWLCILRILRTAIKLRYRKYGEGMRERLTKLAKLHERRMLTDEEFYSQREKMLKG